MLQSALSISENTFHLVVVVDIELQPAWLLQVYFHCVVLELGGVKIFCNDIASWEVYEVELDRQRLPDRVYICEYIL